MITARTAGFCFGVEKAVGVVYDLVGQKMCQGDRYTGTFSRPSGAKQKTAEDSAEGVWGADIEDSAGDCQQAETAAGNLTGKRPEGESAAVGAETSADIVTYGPIIHNEVVVEDLRRKGVGVINSPEEIPAHRNGTIVIRSHGVPRELYDTIQGSGAKVVDTTCTFVKRIHDIVAEESAAGRQIVIIGNHGHAEVEGHKGWCADPKGHPAVVIETEEEARKAALDPAVPVSVVAQTTFNGEKFGALVDILRKRGFDLQVHNTICNATRERQEEARQIAAKVDLMLVIGGRSSSNTAKLYDICREVCPRTLLIQTVADLKREGRVSPKVIGITAGASTPRKIIEEVQRYVRGADF